MSQSPEYDAFHSAVMNLPMVKSLLEKNKKLRKENKELKAFIRWLPVFQSEAAQAPTPSLRKLKNIVIKEEPHVSIPAIGKVDEDEVVVIPQQPNIVYELEEEANEVVEEEEAEEANEVVEQEEEAEEASEVVEEEEAEEANEVVEAEEAEEANEVVEAEEETEEETSEVVEEDGDEVFEVQIQGKRYYTTDVNNGPIYAVLSDDEPGDEVGKFVNGKAKFT